MLHNQRLKVIKQYIELLGKGDYESISDLFIKNGLAVSSLGKIDNPPHFYKTLFTKTISKPEATLINLFEGRLDHKMMTAILITLGIIQLAKEILPNFSIYSSFKEIQQKSKWS